MKDCEKALQLLLTIGRKAKRFTMLASVSMGVSRHFEEKCHT